MNDAKKTKYLLLIALWIVTSGISARALDPNQPAGDFLRTNFTAENGLSGTVVDHIEQTRDGFLWLVTNHINLVRFDGKNFNHFEKPRPGNLAVAPDGDLWVGTLEGLIRIPSAGLDQFTLGGLVSYHPGPGLASRIICLRFSRSGALWVGTAAGLFRYERDQFVAVGPRVATLRIQEAPDGRLLLITKQGFMELAGSEVVSHPQLAAQLGVKDNEIFDVLRDTRGNTWYCTALGVAREKDGRIEKLSPYAPNGHAATHAYEDPQGNVWFGKDEGLFRATAAGLELVAARMKVRTIYSDRDGNLWVGTNGDGLYRFKDRAARMFTTADGLPNDLIMTVITARDGSIWTGANCGGITRFDGTRFHTYNEKNGLLNSCVYALAEDTNGDLWIGTWGGGAFRYHNGSFTQYSKNQGMDDIVTSIVAARDGSVWFGTPHGLTQFKNGQFRTFTTADGLSDSSSDKVFEDRAGVIWTTTPKGLDRLVNGRFENVTSVPKRLVFPFAEDRNGGFYVTIEDGSITTRLDKNRTQTIGEFSAFDMVETKQGEMWFGGLSINRVQPGSFARPRPHDEPLDFEEFSTDDGLATTETTSVAPTLALTPDDKLYAATPKGLAMFDLRRLAITNAKPSIYLTDITIGRNTERATGREVVLPPGSYHVEIHFAAVEISAPEKIRFQYRLEGVDSEWLDAPRGPVAIYSNIPVGTHTLRIRACNRNGIWDRQGVMFSLTQQPYFYQTRWFLAVMIALGLMLVVLIYRLRLAQISRQMSARFDERLAERTRVARELHDTLLQTVQGSKLVADHALENSSDHARTRRALEQLSTWLAQATEEGRAALLSLRASTTEKNDLAGALRRAIEECVRANGTAISFSVNGNAREIHPVVVDEVYRIGYEAIRNACAHSGAGNVTVRLEYGHDLTLRVGDNGAGIESEVIEKGREGHFGLRGMRERAERIGGKFNLVSAAGSGTVITLVVPGRIAFHAAIA